MKLLKNPALCATAAALFGILPMKNATAQTKPPGYMIIEYEVTDSAGYREYLSRTSRNQTGNTMDPEWMLR